MFLQRSASLLPSPNGFTASSVSCEMLKREQLPLGEAAVLERIGVIAGLGEVALGELALVGDDQPAVASAASTLVLSAAGFIATSTSGASPAVSIAVEPKLIWNAETPNIVPCGARISAGKSGKVARSLPASAVESVNWPAGQLHAVAAIAGKTHDHRFQRRVGVGFLGGQQVGCRLGHAGPSIECAGITFLLRPWAAR